MLNKEEKRNLTYVKNYLEKINDICLNTEDKYEEEEYHERCEKCFEELERKRIPLWRVTSDIFEMVLSMQTIVRSILYDEFVKRETYEQSKKRRERKWAKEKKEREEAMKLGQEIATNRYKYIKLNSMKKEQKKEHKIWKKGYSNGMKTGKEIEHLTNDEILKKAEMIKLNRKIGFDKEE